jgi:hypothetical protein
LDRVAVEGGPVVRGAGGVEPFQIPDPGAALEVHLLLEREVGGQFRRERTGEAVGVHDRTSSGTSRTHSSRRSQLALIYRLVDSELTWPSTAEILGNPTAARSSRDAA